MRAVHNGTPAEHAFAVMGWVSATEAKEKQMQPCRLCGSFFLKEIINGDGNPDRRPYCSHVRTVGIYGQATRPNASCRQWTRKEIV